MKFEKVQIRLQGFEALALPLQVVADIAPAKLGRGHPATYRLGSIDQALLKVYVP